MADPITDADRDRVRKLHAEGLSRNQIAKRIHRAQSTVSAIAKDLGLDFDRSRTEAGTKARQADAAARRAQLALDLLADAERLRAQLWQPTTVHSFGGKDNTYAERQVPEPPFRDKRDITVAVGTLVEKHIRLVEHDAGGNTEQVASLLGAMFEGLQAKHGTEPE